MNLAQLARKTRFEIDAIRTGDVASALWSDEEVYSAINDAVDRALRVYRLAGNPVPTKSMLSTAAAVDLLSQSYNPNSLRLADGTIDYILPPDLVSIVSISPITTGFDGIRFRPLKTSQKVYIDQRTIPDEDLSSLNNDEATLFYTRIGRRTLRVVPEPRDTIDVDLVYTYRPPILKVYSTGTITILGGTPTIITGASTLWVDRGLRTPAEYIPGAIATAVDLNREYETINTIDSNTQVTTYKDQTAVGAGGAYRIAMVPLIPEEHHNWLAKLAGAFLFRKINVETSDKAAQALEQQLMNEIQPEAVLDQMQESLVVDPYELP